MIIYLGLSVLIGWYLRKLYIRKFYTWHEVLSVHSESSRIMCLRRYTYKCNVAGVKNYIVRSSFSANYGAKLMFEGIMLPKSV